VNRSENGRGVAEPLKMEVEARVFLIFVLGKGEWQLRVLSTGKWTSLVVRKKVGGS
jgi:hypothetical protein